MYLLLSASVMFYCAVSSCQAVNFVSLIMLVAPIKVSIALFIYCWPFLFVVNCLTRPWFSSNITLKCEVDRMNGTCMSRWITDGLMN